MAKQQILVSDLSQETIQDGELAEVSIKLISKPKSTYKLDAKASEIELLLASARETVTRGRPKKQ
jgi:hypothetical protein